MGPTEILLLVVAVIGIPLAIAVTVTLWSLKQVQYRPKRRRGEANGEVRPVEREVDSVPGG